MMMSNALIELLILIIPLVSLVGLVYLWYRVFKGRSGGDLPTCAKCGYAVRGLMGLSCPECGADLREVGIVTPKQRGAVSPLLFVLLWTLLLPGPAFLVSVALSREGPKISVQSEVVNLTSIASGQYRSVKIGNTKNHPFGGTDYTNLQFEGNTSQYAYMTIDPVAMTCEDWRVTSTTSTAGTTIPLDRQAVLDTLMWSGADITRQDVIDEADELLAIIRGIPTQGLANLNPMHFTQTNYSSGSYDRRAEWFMGVLLGGWVIVWIGGFVMYYRIRRKNLSTQPNSPGSASPSQSTD